MLLRYILDIWSICGCIYSNPNWAFSFLALEKESRLSLMENNIQVVKVMMEEADDVSMEFMLSK